MIYQGLFMIKKIIPFVLLPFQAIADVTWVQASDIPFTTLSNLATLMFTTEQMTFKYVDGRQFSSYQTYCSTDQSDAESNTGTGTLRGTLGEYTWSANATSLQSATPFVSTNILGHMYGTAINRGTLTLYCLLHPPGVTATDPSVSVTGLIVPAD